MHTSASKVSEAGEVKDMSEVKETGEPGSKVWFVTGANRGIGAHVARAALAAGHRVVASGRSLAQLRAAYQDAPQDRIALVELDVAQQGQAQRAIAAAIARFGRIDVLVNNAGYGLLGYFEELGDAAIRQQFDANVFGLMDVLRAALPVMRQQRCGHIVNLSSIGGALGFGGAAVYCASKYAVEGLSASLRQEVAQFGIHVTVVEPGFFRTDFLDPSSVRYGAAPIDDYAGQAADGAAKATVKSTYDAYSHQQPGDPALLGKALVTIANMAEPPRQFIAGSDAIGFITPDLQARLAEARRFDDLSRSTDGAF